MPACRRSALACALSLASIASTLATSGCDALVFESTSTVKFFAAHAGMPTDTGFPDYGDAGSTRVFLTDLGWEVALSEVYVTTQAIRLVRCGKQQGTEIEMFWGTCPEDFVTSQDRETLPLGALTIEDGDFCEVEVVFGPYVDDGGEEEHTKPSNPEVVGATVLIEGVARRDPGDGMIIEVPFALRVEDELVATIDVSALDAGQPFSLDNETYARNLSVLKTYDRFFDGVDFTSAGPADLEAAVKASLELDTRIYDGATIVE